MQAANNSRHFGAIGPLLAASTLAAVLWAAVPVDAVWEQNCNPGYDTVWEIKGTVVCADRDILTRNVVFYKQGSLTLHNVHLTLNPTAEKAAHINLGGTALASDRQSFYAYDSEIDSASPNQLSSISGGSNVIIHIIRTKVEDVTGISLGPTVAEARIQSSHLIQTSIGAYATSVDRNPFLVQDTLMEGARYGEPPTGSAAIDFDGDPTIENVVIVGYGVGLEPRGDAHPSIQGLTISYCGAGIVKAYGDSPFEIHDSDVFNNWNRLPGGYGGNASFPGDGSDNWWGLVPPDPIGSTGYDRGLDYTPYRTAPVHPERLPALSISGLPASTVAGSSIALSASATPSQVYPDPIAEYVWYFGDGSKASGQQVTHAYTTPGTYNVLVSVYDAKGLSNNVQRTITVTAPNQAPMVGAIASSPAAPRVGQSVTLSAQGQDADGDGLSYAWTIPGKPTATGSQVTTSFDSAGPKTVNVRVSDGRGGEATQERTIDVQPATSTTSSASSTSSSTSSSSTSSSSSSSTTSASSTSSSSSSSSSSSTNPPSSGSGSGQDSGDTGGSGGSSQGSGNTGNTGGSGAASGGSSGGDSGEDGATDGEGSSVVPTDGQLATDATPPDAGGASEDGEGIDGTAAGVEGDSTQDGDASLGLEGGRFDVQADSTKGANASWWMRRHDVADLAIPAVGGLGLLVVAMATLVVWRRR